jgi:hypothetical protein
LRETKMALKWPFKIQARKVNLKRKPNEARTVERNPCSLQVWWNGKDTSLEDIYHSQKTKIKQNVSGQKSSYHKVAQPCNASDEISKKLKLEKRLEIPKGTLWCKKANGVCVLNTCRGLESLFKGKGRHGTTRLSPRIVETSLCAIERLENFTARHII